ncbi:hypothetical protein CFE70_001327 [Pyrenophora teres f. teres 0-1]|nr:hypothetical protein HRS9139_09896 [Pyrenophora teres f. teres]KAE8826313.1 hypothetical protein PTNB85_09258 [Pyrenophora teres f. teres]KAE8832675.1 hypothetical protein HRS9122_08388 [Pyrenophora teres f. teres]KAE8852627.1 hypothetical protein PTNB29_10017 [Pyrenophora teres f. teres]CAE7002631.1 DUF3752 domain containing protein [Pyrenophora teres f. teres]
MPSIGPTMPPHLAKRSRDEDDDNERDSSPDSSDKRRRVIGPAPPPSAFSPQRTVGPSLPPATTSPPPAQEDEQDDDSDSSNDDDFGPAPPPVGATYTDEHGATPATSAFDTLPEFTEAPKKVQRDEWMTLPPTQDDLAARMDPTKMRARKFNTGKGSASTGGGLSSAWTETPEQKLKRLQDEALGISAPSNSAPTTSDSKRSKEEERRVRKMREKIDAARGKSLVEQHQEKGTGKEKEDDPSKRAFDYKKDMAVSGTVNHKQRREMLDKSKGFSDRFASGSFL